MIFLLRRLAQGPVPYTQSSAPGFRWRFVIYMRLALFWCRQTSLKCLGLSIIKPRRCLAADKCLLWNTADATARTRLVLVPAVMEMGEASASAANLISVQR